jgi:CubicO group peptidase (beta-lactamase class C family)
MRRTLATMLLAAMATLALLPLAARASDIGVDVDKLAATLGGGFIANPAHVGLSIGVIKDGVRHTYHFGSITRDATVAPTDRTLYELASLTKSYTGMLLARAVVDGKLALDDDVRRYLPADCAGLAFQGQPIRIVDLASHTAGLPKNLPAFIDGASPQQLLQQYASMSRATFLKALSKVRLSARPGTAYAYSNTGAQLAGLVLEHVYGASYDSLVQRLIARPLRMADTGTVVPASARARYASRYNGKGESMPELAFWRTIPAAGYLKSTIADQLDYLAWNLAESDPVVALAHKVTFQHTDERGDDIGLFWFVRCTGGGRLLRHAGGSFGTTSFALLHPDAHIGVILLANDADTTTEKTLAEIADKLADALSKKASNAPASAQSLHF